MSAMKLSDIDPELQYCPRCGDEYRAEMRTCAACTVELVSGQALLAAVKPQAPAQVVEIGVDEPVAALRSGPLPQMKELLAALRKRGVAGRLSKPDGGACGCKGPEVVLEVRQAEAQAAMAVLAEDYWQTTGLAEHDTRFAGAVFDEQAEETLCPACGTRFSTSETTCPDCGLCFG